jgi:Mn2+/Fe2+ NRAMP family transporter
VNLLNDGPVFRRFLVRGSRLPVATGYMDPGVGDRVTGAHFGMALLFIAVLSAPMAIVPQAPARLAFATGLIAQTVARPFLAGELQAFG